MLNENKIMVLIPTYNEEKSIGQVIRGVRKSLPQADIVVVDGESSDSTEEIARKLEVIILKVPHSLGIGGGVETGFSFADLRRYDMVVRVDGDGQHSPNQIPRLMQPILNGKADVTIGSRYIGAGDYKASLSRTLSIKLFSLIISAIIRQKITDATSGFQVVNRRVIEFLSRSYFFDYSEVEAIVLLRKVGFKILEIPVSMEKRTQGSSSFTFVRAFYYIFTGVLLLLISLLREKTLRRDKEDVFAN
ncbi:Undecaprenyl-phosphate mannosyltransferase [subsurface metagenome]